MLALLSLSALLLQAMIVPVAAQNAAPPSSARTLTETERILHILNRLGFGARPGDVERVRAMGIDRYIQMQLQPEKIDDRALNARLEPFPVLRMTNGELLAKYPQPNRLFRQLQREGRLPAELARRGEARRNENAAPGQMPEQMNGQMPAATGATANADEARSDYRRAIRQYYAANDLLQPQLIMQELQASRILRAAYSERQLQEVMVDFWSNHFNIFAGKGVSRWFLPSYDRDVIRPHALGNFRDLLRATAESSAMLFYLDNFQSVSPNAQARGRGMNPNMNNRMNNRRRMMRRQPQEQMQGQPQQARPARTRRGINENYARELMELHTLGVDGGYTQKDIIEVARAFTGWTILNPRGYNGNDIGGDAGTFRFNPRLHDAGEKIVLGNRVAAGGGIEDGVRVLDMLARHPATARFIATKLSRRFVTDNPSPALVARVAAAFTKSDGDMKETLRALFTSPEFNSPEAYRAKIKTPFELTASAIRALGAETDARPALHNMLARMGEPLYGYQAPTGYPDTAAAWVSTGALLERLNFALALAANRIPGTRVQLASLLPNNATANAKDKERLAEALLNSILHGQVSPATRATLMKQINNPTPTAPNTDAMPMDENMMRGNNRARRTAREVAVNMSAGEAETRRIIGLIIGTPEFQRQ